MTFMFLGGFEFVLSRLAGVVLYLSELFDLNIMKLEIGAN